MKKRIGKVERIIVNLHDKKIISYPKNEIKTSLNHGLILNKLYRIINLSKKVWLKSYSDMNTELRKNAKNCFEKDFVKLISNSVSFSYYLRPPFNLLSWSVSLIYQLVRCCEFSKWLVLSSYKWDVAKTSHIGPSHSCTSCLSMARDKRCFESCV